MNILWLAHRDIKNPRAGGAERTIYEVGRRLVREGHKVTLLTSGFAGGSKTENIEGMKVLRYGHLAAVHLVMPYFIFRGGYDVVINDLGHAIPWPSTFMWKGKRIVFFRHLHARSLPGQVNPFLAKIITAIEKTYPLIYGNTPFVTESSTSRNDLVNLSIKAENITLIPPGVDSEKFKPGKKTDYPSMVYFGGVRDYKRPEVSIYLAHELFMVFPQIRLFFVGEGTGIVRLKRLVSELGIESNVQFMGRLDEDDLVDTVSKSWINIHSSVTEGWGYSVIEASSAGTPTVAFDVPGISDSIRNGYNGLKVENGNIHDLLDAALQILVNPLQWWVSSREVALEYSWDETVRSWERLIREVGDGNTTLFPSNVSSTEGQH